MYRDERFAEKRIGGVPVIRVRTFADYYGRELEAFVAGAARYRGEPYVILDVRGNRGGNTTWPRQWIHAFTGGSPSLKQALTELVSRTSMTGRANIFALSMHAYRDKERAFARAEHDRFRAEAVLFDEPDTLPYWSEVAVPVVEPIASETTLIVIQDGRVASAGRNSSASMRAGSRPSPRSRLARARRVMPPRITPVTEIAGMNSASR